MSLERIKLPEEVPNKYSKNGRPSTGNFGYRDGFAKLVYKFRLLGLTPIEIREIFKISGSALKVWMQIPEFADAWEKGGIAADARVAKALLKRATGYNYTAQKVFHSHLTGETTTAEYVVHVPPDPGAAFKWLTNRQPAKWKEKISQEITGKDGEPLQPPVIVFTPVEPDRK